MSNTSNTAFNRCERCNRSLKDSRAKYGWWCAQVMGVSQYLNDTDDDTWGAFIDGTNRAGKNLSEYKKLGQSVEGGISDYYKYHVLMSLALKDGDIESAAKYLNLANKSLNNLPKFPEQKNFSPKAKEMSPLEELRQINTLPEGQLPKSLISSDISEDSGTYKIFEDLQKRYYETTNPSENLYIIETAHQAKTLYLKGTPLLYAQNKIIEELHKNAETAKEFQRNLINNIKESLRYSFLTSHEYTAEFSRRFF